MSTTTALTSPPTSPPALATGPAPRPGGGLVGLTRETWVLTRRSLARIRNQPEMLTSVTAQPVMFVLLFAYVFGSAIHLGGSSGGTAAYREYLIGGLFGLTAISTMVGTAVGITTDMQSGIVDRFRSLPISRAAVLAGRTMSDLLTSMLGLAVTALTGLAVGWRIHNGPADALAAVGLVLLLSFAVSWAGVCLGLLFRSPEGVQGGGFILFLPLMFVSNAFVPTTGMPTWLRAFANWNPVSAAAAACRKLFGNPNPASSIDTWSMQHPELYTVLWAVAMVIVFVPLTVHFYSRKSRA